MSPREARGFGLRAGGGPAALRCRQFKSTAVTLGVGCVGVDFIQDTQYISVSFIVCC